MNIKNIHHVIFLDKRKRGSHIEKILLRIPNLNWKRRAEHIKRKRRWNTVAV